MDAYGFTYGRTSPALWSQVGTPGIQDEQTAKIARLMSPQVSKNNFDGVRIALALIVVFAHLSILTQAPEFREFLKVFDKYFAVEGFFAISGFLVTRSYLASDSVLDYAEKRVRRIYPAYLAAVALSVFIGAYVSTLTLPGFFSSAQTFRYVVSNAALLNFLQPTLPSALNGNPIQAINGALWSIKVEVMLYCCVPAVLYLFARFGKATSAITIYVFAVVWVYVFTYVYRGSHSDEIARQFPGQSSYFVLGALLATDERILAATKWIALASMVYLIATDDPRLGVIADPVAYTAIVIYLSTSAFKCLNFGRYGDMSYGIYLYHFPIIQLLIVLHVFAFNAWIGLAAALAFTLMAAFVSWHVIEKPLLKRTSHYVVAAQR
jgi:peptidoglycan/LPS O-acetylase OafA/YrhL